MARTKPTEAPRRGQPRAGRAVSPPGTGRRSPPPNLQQVFTLLAAETLLINNSFVHIMHVVIPRTVSAMKLMMLFVLKC